MKSASPAVVACVGLTKRATVTASAGPRRAPSSLSSPSSTSGANDTSGPSTLETPAPRSEARPQAQRARVNGSGRRGGSGGQRLRRSWSRSRHATSPRRSLPRSETCPRCGCRDRTAPRRSADRCHSRPKLEREWCAARAPHERVAARAAGGRLVTHADQLLLRMRSRRRERRHCGERCSEADSPRSARPHAAARKGRPSGAHAAPGCLGIVASRVQVFSRSRAGRPAANSRRARANAVISGSSNDLSP